MIENQLDTKDWVIYKITSPSGRVYIGKSSNWMNRYSNYKYFKTAKQVHKQRVLYSSLVKYGFEDHKVEVLERFSSDSNYSSGKEMFWIRSFMCNFSKYPEQRGMNLTDGGEGNLGWKRPEESRLEIIRKNTGKKRSEECRRRIALGKIGNKNGLGRKVTEEHKAILRNFQLGRKRSDKEKESCRNGQLEYNKKTGRTIVQLDDNNKIIKEFGFLYEAAKFFGLKECALKYHIKRNTTQKRIGVILKYRFEI
jgi:group I intron endonuclease